MIRMTFALLVTFAAFVAGALWLAREDVPERRAPPAQLRTFDLDDVLRPAETPTAEQIARSVEQPAEEAAPAPGSTAPLADPPAVAAPPPELEVVEEVVSPLPPFAESPPDEAGDAQPGDDGEPPPVLAAVDQDAWADLIRRMLTLYRRMGGE